MTSGGAGDRTAARLEVAGAAFLFLTLLVTSSVALMLLGPEGDAGSAAVTAKGMIAQLIGSLVTILAAFAWRSRASWRGDGRVVRPLLLYGAFLLIWIPAAIGVTALWRALDLPLEPQPHLAYFAEDRATWEVAAVTLTVCVVGPVAEEVIYRGHLQTGLATFVGPRAAILWSAFLFALTHVTSGWVLFVPIGLLGLLFGWLRQRSGGLLAPILAHVAHNSLTVAFVSASPRILEQLQQR